MCLQPESSFTKKCCSGKFDASADVIFLILSHMYAICFPRSRAVSHVSMRMTPALMQPPRSKNDLAALVHRAFCIQSADDGCETSLQVQSCQKFWWCPSLQYCVQIKEMDFAVRQFEQPKFRKHLFVLLAARFVNMFGID